MPSQHDADKELSKRILLVDDDPLFRRLYSFILKDFGFKVTECKNGLDALNAYLSEPDKFNLILSDFMMPYLTGVQLAKKVRQIDKNIPIVLLTGYVGAIDEQALEDHTINMILEKPILLSDLKKYINSFF
ncbi:hypothetical protein AAU61_05080 [Desulfocarbo indianensis]|nr:hypothetical protein AAU61_05080 [Desulfocarbo indianensis]